VEELGSDRLRRGTVTPPENTGADRDLYNLNIEIGEYLRFSEGRDGYLIYSKHIEFFITQW